MSVAYVMSGHHVIALSWMICVKLAFKTPLSRAHWPCGTPPCAVVFHRNDKLLQHSSLLQLDLVQSLWNRLKDSPVRTCRRLERLRRDQARVVTDARPRSLRALYFPQNVERRIQLLQFFEAICFSSTGCVSRNQGLVAQALYGELLAPTVPASPTLLFKFDAAMVR